MSTLKFTQEAARQLEELYRTRDVVAQRAATMEKLSIKPGERVIDIGCGPGFLSEDIAECTGPAGLVLGVDISADLIALCKARSEAPSLNYVVGDATELGVAGESFDVAVCTQVAEYVPDVQKVLAEMYRVLRPGGRGTIVATDWDTVAWHSSDITRMDAVMKAWEAHCAHPRLPRRLAPMLRETGFIVANVDMFPLVNLQFGPDSYSFGISKMIRDFIVKSGNVPRNIADAWHAELASLDLAGRYYFASSRSLFTVEKPA